MIRITSWVFGVRDNNHPTVEQPQRHEPLFVIVKPVVHDGDDCAGKYCLDVYKVDPVFPDVGPPFALVPFKSHNQIVAIICTYVKANLAENGERFKGRPPEGMGVVSKLTHYPLFP